MYGLYICTHKHLNYYVWATLELEPLGMASGVQRVFTRAPDALLSGSGPSPGVRSA